MADQFCLRWNNFQTNIVNALDSLKCSEDLVDVTLTCEGKNIKAHKVILSACSPYFRNVFKENPCQHPVIILKDVLAEDIVNLLSYMYQGEVFIEESKLTSFLHTAALLQVKGLSGVTQQKEHFTSPNVSNKLFTQLTISPKSQFASHKESKVPTIKKRRCSTSDKPTEVTFGGNQKKTKYESCDIYNLPHLSKVVDSQIGEAETSAVKEAKSEHLAVITNGKSATVAVKTGSTAHQTQSPVESLPTVKVECREESNSPRTPSESSENDSLPDYENSMLARSLMSGINPLKSDTCPNTTKKTSKEPTHPKKTSTDTPPPTNASKSPLKTSSEELVIKSERESPKPDIDYEPEILLAEQQDGAETTYAQESQMMPFAGVPVPSTSANPWNNSAICGDCPHCGMKYSNQSALKYHVRLMHSDLTNRLCCYLCPRSFTMRETFKEHMWNTHGHRN